MDFAEHQFRIGYGADKNIVIPVFPKFIKYRFVIFLDNIAADIRIKKISKGHQKKSLSCGGDMSRKTSKSGHLTEAKKASISSLELNFSGLGVMMMVSFSRLIYTSRVLRRNCLGSRIAWERPFIKTLAVACFMAPPVIYIYSIYHPR
jgi:hypothetical protein